MPDYGNLTNDLRGPAGGSQAAADMSLYVTMHVINMFTLRDWVKW